MSQTLGALCQRCVGISGGIMSPTEGHNASGSRDVMPAPRDTLTKENILRGKSCCDPPFAVIGGGEVGVPCEPLAVYGHIQRAALTHILARVVNNNLQQNCLPQQRRDARGELPENKSAPPRASLLCVRRFGAPPCASADILVTLVTFRCLFSMVVWFS